MLSYKACELGIGVLILDPFLKNRVCFVFCPSQQIFARRWQVVEAKSRKNNTIERYRFSYRCCHLALFPCLGRTGFYGKEKGVQIIILLVAMGEGSGGDGVIGI